MSSSLKILLIQVNELSKRGSPPGYLKKQSARKLGICLEKWPSLLSSEPLWSLAKKNEIVSSSVLTIWHMIARNQDTQLMKQTTYPAVSYMY